MWWCCQVVSFVCPFVFLVAWPGAPAGDPLPAHGKQSQNFPETLTPAWKADSSHHTSEQNPMISSLRLGCDRVEKRGWGLTQVVTDSSSVRSCQIRIQALTRKCFLVTVGTLTVPLPICGHSLTPPLGWPWAHHVVSLLYFFCVPNFIWAVHSSGKVQWGRVNKLNVGELVMMLAILEINLLFHNCLPGYSIRKNEKNAFPWTEGKVGVWRR